MKTDIEVLKQVFTYGHATDTHLDILDYLKSVNVSKSEYSLWGRNAASQQPDSADPKRCCSCGAVLQNPILDACVACSHG